MTDVPTRTPFGIKRDKYFTDLGRFIHAFASMEAQLHYVLWQEAGVSPEVARAILSGAKIDTAKSYVNRLYEARGKTVHPAVKSAFAQMTVINTFRNDLVHYGSEFKFGGISVSNSLMAHTPERLRETPLQADTLNEAESDCYRIKMILALHAATMNQTIIAREPLEDTITKEAAKPWRYKPPQPAPVRKPRPDRRPKREGPQPA